MTLAIAMAVVVNDGKEQSLKGVMFGGDGLRKVTPCKHETALKIRNSKHHSRNTFISFLCNQNIKQQIHTIEVVKAIGNACTIRTFKY